MKQVSGKELARLVQKPGWRLDRVKGSHHVFRRSLQPAAPHPLLGRPTLNIGRIQAGTATNVIPDECRIDIDRRVLPGDSAAPMVALVRVRTQFDTPAERAGNSA